MDCHGGDQDGSVATDGAIVLVGNANVGKSVLFGALTGSYVTVSNYPGTTVEVTRGVSTFDGQRSPVIDTPGVHGLVPLSDDERVTAEILLDRSGSTVVLVADAKNLERSLVLAIELSEMGIPFAMALNMVDEAERRGIEIDTQGLSAALGVPVVATVATRGFGIGELVTALADARPGMVQLSYLESIEEALEVAAQRLPTGGLQPRAAALLLVAGDANPTTRISLDPEQAEELRAVRQGAENRLGAPIRYELTRHRLTAARAIAARVTRRTHPSRSFGDLAGRLTAHPIAGLPLLGAVLYGVYMLVGRFAAGTLVDLLENRFFGEVVNPWAVTAAGLIPVGLLRDFLVGEYGVVTMALTYGLAIVLPIASAFFIAFSVLEDSGYLPRLAVMLDRVFRLMGLNGKAVLPMILGLGCDTMATVSTRILDSRRERLQVTLLLALGVPCSAQLGVVLGMIAGVGPGATALWAGVVVATLLAVGFVAARVIPGASSDFILELPPMRVPSAKNVAAKTLARVEWYVREVIPLFILGTAILFLLDRVGALALLERALAPLIVHWLGLPAQATGAFVIGFLRRDYGAAGLFALARAGALDPLQVVVSLVVITLFIPCIANLMVIIREFGGRVAAAVAAFVFPFAFFVGGVLNLVLRAFGLFGSGS